MINECITMPRHVQTKRQFYVKRKKLEAKRISRKKERERERKKELKANQRPFYMACTRREVKEKEKRNDACVW